MVLHHIEDKIFEDIKNERERQKQHFSEEFDRTNSINDWVAYIVVYLGRITRATRNQKEGYQAVSIKRKMFIKAAALIVAAIESLDTNS